MARKYSSTSIETTLASSIGATGTTMTVATGTGSSLLGGVTLAAGNVDQFTVAIDPDTTSEEIVFITANAGDSFTITRARAGTAAITHGSGATVRHVLTSDDLTAFATAISPVTNVQFAGSSTGSTTVQANATASGTLTLPAATDTLVGKATTDTLTNKTLTSPVLTTPSISNINAKGDILVGTADNTLGIASVGSDGATLFANSAATAGISWSSTQVGKNYLINADCAIDERSAGSVTLTTSANFPVDRFFARRSAGSTGATAVRSTSSALEGFPAFIRVQRTSSNTATDTLYVGQTVETLNARQLQNETVTFSFYARKGANYTGASDALQVRVYTGTGTDQTGIGNGYTGAATPISDTATLTTSWQRFSFTATLATTITQIQALVQYVPVGTASTNDYFDITGFQLEVGSVATPFALASGGQYGTELALCRRYYERISATSASATTRYGSGFATGGTTAKLTIQYKVAKRAAISSSSANGLAALSALNNTLYGTSSYTLDESNKESLTIGFTASGSSFTTGQYVELTSWNNSSGYLEFNAEIG